ncbi:MAG: hypothetical protein ACHQHN_18790 [Sphingobacteriales bacterium]
MLHTISWQSYITALLICTAAWYAYIGLRFYRPQPKERSAMPPVDNTMTVIMGQINPDSGTGLYDPGQLSFGVASSDDISDQTLPKGPADELLAEAETLISAYAGNEDKAGFLSLFKVLLSKYEVFADEISLPNIISRLQSFAKSQLPFQINETEWPLKFNA